jgi:hypothetical protein
LSEPALVRSAGDFASALWTVERLAAVVGTLAIAGKRGAGLFVVTGVSLLSNLYFPPGPKTGI